MTDCARCPRVRRKNAMLKKMAESPWNRVSWHITEEKEVFEALVEEAKKEAGR